MKQKIVKGDGMYCKFPKKYFFEVEELKDLIEFDNMTEVFREEKNEEKYEGKYESSIEEIFEFSWGAEEKDLKKGCCMEVNWNKNEKEDKHKDESTYKNKCKCENKFFEICDEEYSGNIKKDQKCKCKCNKK